MTNKPLSAAKLKIFASLHQRKYRTRHGLSFVEGVRSVESALAASRALEVVVSQTGLTSDTIRRLVDEAQVPVFIVSDRSFGRLSNVTTEQGMFATIAIETAAVADVADSSMVLVLDGIQDPGNVGTIVRTAAWFGVDMVVGGPGTADFYHPKTLRATMGGLWDVKHLFVDNLAALVGDMVEDGRELAVADVESGMALDEWHPGSKVVLVLGSEAHGVRAVASNDADRVCIPGGFGVRSGVESLNVSVAAGVLLNRWRAHRGSAKNG